MGRSAVARMLHDDYYIGVVTLNGVKNPDGQHPPLIDRETFERVQEVLKAHALSGDRSRKHEHYQGLDLLRRLRQPAALHGDQRQRRALRLLRLPGPPQARRDLLRPVHPDQ
ncbi:MAG TPA: recombinase family protein [Solirubrobacteraceae bacterium]|nr:recombinase family protein [Solirubrobacteraceae bacterium]